MCVRLIVLLVASATCGACFSVAPLSRATVVPAVLAVSKRSPEPEASASAAVLLGIPFARRATMSFVVTIAAAAWVQVARSVRRKVLSTGVLASMAKYECFECACMPVTERARH